MYSDEMKAAIVSLKDDVQNIEEFAIDFDSVFVNRIFSQMLIEISVSVKLI